MMKLTKQEVATLESRVDYLDILKGRISNWAMLSDEEEKKLKSVKEAISEYTDYIEELLADLYEEEND